MSRSNKELKRIVKSLLEKEVINLTIRLPVRALLHLKTMPFRLKNVVFEQIACRIPISSIDQFSIKIFDGKNIIIGTPSKSSVANQLFWQGFRGHEPETTQIFYRIAKKAQIIFDIGAHIGFYALLAGAINRKSKIFAFEPVPLLFELLKTNITLNSFANVIPIQKSVIDVDGQIPFYINLESDCSASALKGFREITQEIKVPCITLDKYVEQNNIGKVDLVKIDVEGEDHRVLKGMQRILTKDEPDIICEVLYGRTEEALQEILSGFSYKYYWITDDGLILRDRIVGDNSYRYVNWLFTKKNI